MRNASTVALQLRKRPSSRHPALGVTPKTAAQSWPGAYGILNHRFGRLAHGLWLPETAVDLPTLCEVARQGDYFVILAPHQAEAVRPHNGEWTAPNTADWTQRPYTISLPNGDTIVASLYDGALARGVAFDGWLHDGEQLAERLIQAGHGDGLVHFATDGESYGHHHPRGENGPRPCRRVFRGHSRNHLTTYEAYLRAHPPEWEARVHAPSSWSCSHGVDRWRADCGCKMDPGADTQQMWRTQLRDALDGLRDRARVAMSEALAQVFHSVDEARLRYVDVIYEQGEAWQRWCTEHVRASQQPQKARALMEIERHLLAMYTSRGWFFDDVTGIEARRETFAMPSVRYKSSTTCWRSTSLHGLSPD